MNPPPFDIEAHMHRHGESLRRLARELVASSADVDDALQETWLTALRSPPRHSASIGGWLATLVRNVIGRSRRQRVRRDRREVAAASHRPGFVTDHASAVERSEIVERLVRAVRALESPYHEVVWSRFFEGRAPRQIAAARGVPVATVKGQLKRGLARLREQLGADGAGWRGALGAAFWLDAKSLAVVGASGGGAAAGASKIIGGGLLMTTWMKGVAVAAVVVIACVLWWPRDGMAAPAAVSGPAEVAAAVAVVAKPSIGTEVEAVPAGDRVAAALPPPAMHAELATIRGRCVDEDGLPLAGVAVQLVAQVNRLRLEEWLVAHDAPEPFQRDLASTNPAGEFTASFPPLAVLDYRLQFATEGREPAFHVLTELAVGLTEVGTIRLGRGVLVRGRVVDAEGSAIGDVQVELTSTEGAKKYRAARADVAGRFDLRYVLPAGTYDVAVSDGFVVRTPDPLVLRLERAIEEVLVTVAVHSGPSIRGHVRDQDGRPVAAAHVTARQRNGRLASSASTGVDGAFVLRGGELERGSAVCIEVGAAGHLQQVHQEPVVWGRQDLEVALQQERSLTVRIEDVDGKPVVKCVLTLVDPDPMQWGSGHGELVVTDDRGCAVFRGARPGTRYLVMNHARDRGLPAAIERLHWDGRQEPVVVRAGELTHRVVRVVDARGQPCAGSRVSICELFEQEFRSQLLLLQPGKWFGAMGGVGRALVMETWTTDAEGVCTARAPARGMGLMVSGSDFVTRRLDAVRLDQPGELVVAIDRGARLRGIIRPDGSMSALRRLHRLGEGDPFPAGHAPILCLMAERTKVPGPGDADRARYELQSDGRFDVGGLPTGRWTLAVEYWVAGPMMAGSRTWSAGELDLFDGQVLDLDIDLAALLPGTLKGTVRRDGRPVANSLVVVRTDFGTDATARHDELLLETDGQGGFEHTTLPGRCRVRMAAGGPWAMSAIDVVRGQVAEAVFDFGRAELAIVLRRQDGGPAAGVVVEPEHGESAITDEAGMAQVRVEVGEVKLRVLPRRLQDGAARRVAVASDRGRNATDSHGDLWIELAVVSVANGETKRLELVLPPEWDK